MTNGVGDFFFRRLPERIELWELEPLTLMQSMDY